MKKKHDAIKKEDFLKVINNNTAGIDIGCTSHFISISPDLDVEPVKEIGVFTEDLRMAIDWLKSKGIKSVAMESTGVYWIPFYEMLESARIEVLLVNSRHVKNVPGRKSDVLDCQWIRQLHSCGLLRGSFRPPERYCELRSIVRQRDMLIQEQSSYKLRMQKAMTEMNIHMHNVISELTSQTGLNIMRDIVRGIRDPKILASHRTDRHKCSAADLEKSLDGNYRAEHVFTLKQNLDFYDFYQSKVAECDRMIEASLNRIQGEETAEWTALEKKEGIQKKRRKNELYFDAKPKLEALTGVDLTAIDGLDSHSVLKIIAETGTNMDKWPTVKHFASWLGLAPGTKISGGKKLSTRTKKCKQRASNVFRLAAHALSRSHSALGAFLRRKKAQLGAPEAITATAHKIAKIFYLMLKYKKSYEDLGADYYEQRYKDRIIKNIRLRAKALGYLLVESDSQVTG